MALIEQYLESVRTLLPKGERDDIIAELSANVAAQMEDRQAELGRPLAESDERALLERLGSPLAVAQRYAAGRGHLAFGRQWVGPVLFPLYSKVLALNLSLTFGVCVVVTVALGWPRGLSGLLSAVAFQFLIQFAIVTSIFALAERHLSRVPGAPPPARLEGPDGEGSHAESRLESFAELVALCGLFVAAYATRASFAALFQAGPEGLYLSPVLHDASLAILGLAVVWAVQAVVNLLRPGWTRVQATVRALTSAAWLALLVYVLLHGPYVLEAGIGGTAAAGRGTDAINRSIAYSVAVVLAVSAVSVIWRVARVARRRASSTKPFPPPTPLR